MSSTLPTISGYYRQPGTIRGAYAWLASVVAAFAGITVLLGGFALGIVQGGRLTDTTKVLVIAGFAVAIVVAAVLNAIGDRAIRRAGATFRAALAEDVRNRYGLTLRGTVYARTERQVVDATAHDGRTVPIAVEFTDEDTRARVQLLVAP